MKYVDDDNCDQLGACYSFKIEDESLNDQMRTLLDELPYTNLYSTFEFLHIVYIYISMDGTMKYHSKEVDELRTYLALTVNAIYIGNSLEDHL